MSNILNQRLDFIKTRYKVHTLPHIIYPYRSTYIEFGETGIHNLLQGLQGGQNGEYYHLTLNQLNFLNSLSNSTGIINVTFQELSDLIDNSELNTSFRYRITDFQTIHIIPNTTSVYNGTIEPLIVVPLSENKIDDLVFSEMYPNDTIKYNSLKRLDGTTPIKGEITYRRDNINRIQADYDFRERTVRLWKMTGKQYEIPTSLTSTTFDLELTFSPNLNGTYMNIYRKWEVRFPSDITHDAGTLTITVRKGAFSFTQPLLKRDGTTVWSANELQNLTGPLINCPVRNSFVLMNGINTGEQFVDTYSATSSATVFTRGNGIRFDVDPDDYQDYKTLNLNVNVQDVTILSGPTSVFKSTVREVFLGPDSNNNVFNGSMRGSIFERNFTNNILAGSLNWSNIYGWTNSNMWCNSINYFISVGGDQLVSNTFVLPGAGTSLSTGATGTTIVVPTNLWFIKTESLPLDGTGIFFFDGGGGDTLRSGISLMKGARNSFIGGFTPTQGPGVRGFTEYRWLNGTSVYEVQESLHTFPSIALKNLPTPIGSITPIGIDEKGNIVLIT